MWLSVLVIVYTFTSDPEGTQGNSIAVATLASAPGALKCIAQPPLSPPFDPEAGFLNCIQNGLYIRFWPLKYCTDLQCDGITVLPSERSP